MATWSPVLLPPKFRLLPWAPFARLCYLAVAAYGVFRVGTWSPALLLAALVPLLPVLLHLSLVVPQQQPLTLDRPYIFRWIYGAPVMAITVPAVLLTFKPAMGGHLGYHFAFTLWGIFLESSVVAQFAMAAGCFWLAAVPAIQFFRAIRKDGWERLFSRPITALFAILLRTDRGRVGGLLPLSRLESSSRRRAADCPSNFAGNRPGSRLCGNLRDSGAFPDCHLYLAVPRLALSGLADFVRPHQTTSGSVG